MASMLARRAAAVVTGDDSVLRPIGASRTLLGTGYISLLSPLYFCYILQCCKIREKETGQERKDEFNGSCLLSRLRCRAPATRCFHLGGSSNARRAGSRSGRGRELIQEKVLTSIPEAATNKAFLAALATVFSGANSTPVPEFCRQNRR
jgi:hypothetical protein